MIHQLKLNGTIYPVLFGNYAFRKLKTDAGLTIGDLLTGSGGLDLTFVADVVAAGIKGGALASNQSVPSVTGDEVALWLDMQPDATANCLTWFNEAVMAMTSTEAERKEETGKKSKK